MSKAVQANSALVEANKLKAQGYKTRMHTPELQEFKTWFDQEYAKGGKRVLTLLKEGRNVFPKLKLPSQPALQNYVDKYYEPPHVMVVGYNPDYLKTVEKFDGYLKLVWLCEEALARYTAAKTEEENNVPGIPRESHKWFLQLSTLVNQLLEWDVKLKIRSGMMLPNSLTLNQLNVNTNNPEQGEMDGDAIAELLRNKEVIDVAEHEVREFAKTRNIALFGSVEPK